eukprot:8193825-Pyramimonas_sp.AAC.1
MALPLGRPLATPPFHSGSLHLGPTSRQVDHFCQPRHSSATAAELPVDQGAWASLACAPAPFRMWLRRIDS